MKFTTILMLLIPVVGARHHHRTLLETILKSRSNLFTRVDNDLQSVMNKIFDSLNLGNNFLAKSRVRLLLTMHYDLKSIAEKNFEIYEKMKDAVKPDTGNKTNNKVELYELIEEILNDKVSNTSSIMVEPKKRRKHVTHKIKVNDTSDSISDFADSQEFMQFVRDFVKKVNSLSRKDFIKSPSTLSVDEPDYPTESNLKVWRPPRVLELDYVNDTSNRRIYRGKRSKIKDYPFMVSIHLMGSFTCAGSLINKDLVISAASCLQLLHNNRFYRENPKTLSVRVGSEYFIKGGEMIEVIETYFHPEYDPKTLANNLVVLRLLKHIKFRRKQKRIKRILIDRSRAPLADNTDGIIVVGWGPKSRTQVIDQWEKMLVSRLDIYHIGECADVYSRVYVTKKNFCAGFITKGGGACNKDLGGPGIVGGKLVGVISFGAPSCGTLDSPTVFTKLGYYAAWIDEIMNMDVPSVGRPTTKYSLVTKHPFAYRVTTELIKPITTIDYENDITENIDETELDIRSLKTVLNNLAESNSSVLTDILYGGYSDVEEEDFYDLFKTTEKPDPKQHPLVNKSIFLIPELYETPTTPTTEYETIVLTTGTTLLPNPFTDPLDPTTAPIPRPTPNVSAEYMTDVVDEILRTGPEKFTKRLHSDDKGDSEEDTIIYYDSYEDTKLTTVTTTPNLVHHTQQHQKYDRPNELVMETSDELQSKAAPEYYDDDDYFGMKIT